MYFQPQPPHEPRIRLFRSGLLEALTHVPPWLVFIVWVPIIAWFACAAVTGVDGRALAMGELAWLGLLGLAVWTLVEYSLHRFVFHWSPRNPTPSMRRIVFLFHGIHHVQPWDERRLLMPPTVSLPLAGLFYLLFSLVFVDALGEPGWLAPVFATFLTGYLVYDLTHFATHHLPARSAWFRWLKRHHLLHHYSVPEQRFGVTSPLWDFVLGTMPRRAEEPRSERAS